MANYRSFLTGLAGSAAQGIKERRDEERDLAKTMSSLIMKAQLEQQMKDPLEQEYKRAQIDKIKREQEQPQKWEPTDEESAIRFFQKTRGAAKDGQQIIGEDEEGKPIYAPAKALTGETAGKLAMLSQGERDLQEAESVLFPNGKFDKGMAFNTNFPGGGLPGSEGRTVYSKVLNAINAKLRAETGAAATPSEINNIMQRFMPTMRDSDSTAKDKYRRLKEFMSNTKTMMDPGGKYQYSSEQPIAVGDYAGKNSNKRKVAGFIVEEIPE